MQTVKLNENTLTLISQIFDKALELKIFTRNHAPFYNINETDLKNIKELLIDLYNNIISLSKNFQLELYKSDKTAINLETFSSHIIITNSKSIHKKLLMSGMDKNKIIFITSPLSLEDFKLINPSISPSNVNSFIMQIEKNWTIIKKTIASNPNLAYYFVDMPDNLVNKLIKDKIQDYFNSQKLVLNSISGEYIEKL